MPNHELGMIPSATSNRVVRPQTHWMPPPRGFFKVNCDAAWGPPSTAGLGVVVRDSTGRSISGLAIKTTCGTVAEAEASAILHGISLASTLNLRKVHIESDAKEVVLDLNGLGRGKNWKTYPILDHIRRLATGFEECNWDWVPREANKAAHCAASLACGTVGPQRWANQPPPSLTLVLRNDGLPCPPATEM
ncbi:uncharacterized protein LOC133732260 [Rosa rugosa]|uniref:uncharacterized protein LOC133732260 n=1 Tax=Rosa rugosa TaxID=74645 RepID=UPI002B409835|nr:uncharacterized protein LOC133732260 [Rosa rugosa]